jgi:glutamyl-tRNA reductase
MNLSAAGYAYPDLDGSTRADIAMRLRSQPVPEDVFVLATCLRTEIVVNGGPSDLEQAVEKLLGGPGFLELASVRTGEKAVEHLFRIAAGLESPILGEREILTQFRQSLQASQDQHILVDGLFIKLLETAVSVGRQARQLLPESPHDSMAAVAAQVVGWADRVAVLGAGSMARSVVAGLMALPAPPVITVLARDPGRVQIDGVTVLTFDGAVGILDAFPAVVSATSAKRRLVPDEQLAEVLMGRSAPLMLVDMAMPPDFSPPSSSPVTYIDIDALAAMADRTPRRSDADALVAAAAAEAYRHVSDHASVGPVIAGLMQSADEVVERSVGRFVGRLGRGNDEELLLQTAHTVARTLLAGPVSYLRSADRPQGALDVIADAFRVAEPADGD